MYFLLQSSWKVDFIKENYFWQVFDPFLAHVWIGKLKLRRVILAIATQLGRAQCQDPKLVPLTELKQPQVQSN